MVPLLGLTSLAASLIPLLADMDGAISGGLRGGLIGGVIGGIVGAVAYVFKKKKPK